MVQKQFYNATGKRKTSVAQVRLYPGGGAFVVNDKPVEDAFPWEPLRDYMVGPLKLTDNLDRYGISIKVAGGGISGQAGAIRHGLARALENADPSLRRTLKSNGMLTRDSRIKERKKYGLKGARRAPQYTKR